ncbi:MAG: tRNA(fMet)-specific endonuclease VapC [Nitrosomonadaceae bacterium]|nr:tRNA(fMet)-specific endonuclease VapC [Nitrosomonadaceae bacterium]
MPAPEVFLDSAYAIALSAPTDQYHKQALVLAEQLEAKGTRLITTWAVVLEIGNALARLRYRQAAIELLASLEEDPTVEIIPISDQLYARALRYYQERPDKEWGLTDCISFIVMQDRGLTDALTPDDHFRQAGFFTLMHRG